MLWLKLKYLCTYIEEPIEKSSKTEKSYFYSFGVYTNWAMEESVELEGGFRYPHGGTIFFLYFYGLELLKKHF